MAVKNAIFMGSDTLLQVSNLIDVESGDPVNTATIEVSIFDGDRRHPVSVLEFTSGGVLKLIVGNTITGATGGATAVIVKVSLTSGHWAAGTAAGQIEISGQDGVFEAENINQLNGQDNIATIPAGDSTGLAAVLLGGGQVKIPMNTVGLTTDDFVRIESTKKYNGQFDIDALDAGQDGYVTITAVNVAETFTGNEVVYIGIAGGKDIAITHEGGDADGYYDGIQPDTLESVYENSKYYLFEKITYAGNILLHRYHWAADYYTNPAAN